MADDDTQAAVALAAAWSNPWRGNLKMWPMLGQGILGARSGAGSFHQQQPRLLPPFLGAAQAHLAAAPPPCYLYGAYPYGSYGPSSALDPSVS